MINTKLTRVANAPDLNYASSDRIIMYKNTLKMIIDNPFGVGLNNFEYIHPLYGQAGNGKRFIRLYERDRDIKTAP